MTNPRGLLAGLVLAIFFAGNTALAASADRVIERAKSAIESGDVDPDRDLAPLVDALDGTTDVEALAKLVSAVVDLGGERGRAPAEARRFLLDRSTRPLVRIAKDGKDRFLRGDAIFALRDLHAAKKVLEQVTEMAERDPDPFIQSRGTILRNYLKSAPEEAEVASIEPKDAERERKALAFLKKNDLSVSIDQLRTSAMEGKDGQVRALLDAGVDPNGEVPNLGTPLYNAVFSGCGAKQGETPGLRKTVQVLLKRGADPKKLDPQGNSVLVSAAQMCGPGIVGDLLDAGVDWNVRSKGGVTPLTMAFLMKRFESAEVLIDHGARLDAKEAMIVQTAVQDAKAKPLVARAAGN